MFVVVLVYAEAFIFTATTPRMGSCCCRPEFSSIDEIVKARHLDCIDGLPDYPRAANDFYHIGAPDFAIFCWLAASKSYPAEITYERAGFYLVDNRLGSRIPVWRMIMGVRTNDRLVIEEGRDEYLRAIGGSVPAWLERALALI